jgi:O-antigen/teichoic acid export membrane protein
MISGKFIKSSMLFTIGGVMPLAGGFVLLPFYTNLLTIEQYGLLALYISISLVVQIIVSYALDTYIGVQYVKIRDEGGDTNKFVSSIFTLLLAIGLSFIGLTWLAGDFIFDAIFSEDSGLNFMPYGLMSVATGVCNSFLKSATGLLSYRQEPVKYFLFNLFNFVITISISLYGLFSNPYSLDGPMYGRILPGIGIFLLSLLFLIRQFKFRLVWNVPKELHVFCLPYVGYLIMTWIVGNIDRFIISDAIDLQTVGVFDFALKCALIIEFVQNGVTAAFYPEVFKIWRADGQNRTTAESNRYFNVLTSLSILMTAGLFVVMPLALPLIVKKQEFFASFAFLGVVAASLITRGLYHYYMSVVLYLQKTKVLPIVFGISAVIQIIGTWFAANHFGLIGVVVMHVLIKVVQIVIWWWMVRNYFTFNMNPVKLIVLPLLFIGLYMGLWLSHPTEYVLWEAVVLLIVSGVVIGFVFRKELLAVWSRWTTKA